ncbi:M1 family metallopeptidase [endosymbiont of unidentified scaly snail isolate Monju]|uniref:M1 family metallopeptidase n=1 Tax=endosymbiont of unidentified scaly snail isolate Monju TaxID=1248727 RepID=UPI00038925B3|nr:M1 family aminopeptidase [endosymbiont of unidentified scaly snail isolate Monju]BAN69497.1 peptidase M28 [endosymbiont of unidentified scaly snail isolate Monju]
MKRILYGFLLYLSWLAAAAAGPAHDMAIRLQVDAGRLIVTDRITLDEPSRRFVFRLNSGLRIDAHPGHLERLETTSTQTHYRLTFDRPERHIVLRYTGRPRFPTTHGHGGMPAGEITPQGVWLDDVSAWYPLTGDPVQGARLAIETPRGWEALAVGRRKQQGNTVVWQTGRPLQALYLVAGPFHRHERQLGEVTLAVWLLHDDPALAERYLALLSDYLRHYQALIGPYPYARFTVVENRWPTGLGMPAFTLIGGQVLRLPFIPYTSLPHELLHNWWGNGVWVDYERGNWSEGLTSYLADHWMQERRGKGARYRLRALQRYSNHAAQGRDLPLRTFVSRHDEASQSVGYSKSLMLFHMTRRLLGDAAFEAGLRRLWRQHHFERIGFETALRTLVGDRPDLLARLRPWLARKGAPRLQLGETQVQPQGDGFRLSLVLAQDADPPFDLHLPARPQRLQVDPDYDVLRRLDPREQPPALNLLFGGPTWLVLPADAPTARYTAWRRLAEAWRKRYPGLRVIDDRDADSLPATAHRLLLGWDNRLLDPHHLSDSRYRLDQDGLEAEGRYWPRRSFAVVRVSIDAQGIGRGFIGAGDPKTIEALARKLPHYGSYGVLVFEHGSARNRLKVSPDNPHSPLSRSL